jgi:hypothetical protein
VAGDAEARAGEAWSKKEEGSILEAEAGDPEKAEEAGLVPAVPAAKVEVSQRPHNGLRPDIIPDPCPPFRLPYTTQQWFLPST